MVRGLWTTHAKVDVKEDQEIDVVSIWLLSSNTRPIGPGLKRKYRKGEACRGLNFVRKKYFVKLILKIILVSALTDFWKPKVKFYRFCLSIINRLLLEQKVIIKSRWYSWHTENLETSLEWAKDFNNERTYILLTLKEMTVLNYWV